MKVGTDILNESWHKAWTQWTPKSRIDLRRADKAFKAGYLAAIKDLKNSVEAIAKENANASKSYSDKLRVVRD